MNRIVEVHVCDPSTSLRSVSGLTATQLLNIEKNVERSVATKVQ